MKNGLAGDDSYWGKFIGDGLFWYTDWNSYSKIKEEKMDKEKEKEIKNITNNYSCGMDYSSTDNLPWTTVTTTYVNGKKVEETKSVSNNTSNNVYLSFGPMPMMSRERFIPVKVIYSCPATICYFSDGTKEIVKVTSDEEYVPEVGVAQCIMKKLFKSRNEFKRLVKSGYENEESEVERILHNGMVEQIRQDNLIKSLKAFTSKHD